MTCSKLMINKLGRSHALSDNVYIANIEQASLMLRFVLHMRNIIKFELYYNLSAQLLTIFWRALSQIQANQSNLLTFKN